MLLVKFEKNKELDISMVTSWMFIPKEKSVNINNIPGYQMKFDTDDIPTGFYENSSEFFLDSTKLRRYYVKKI